MTTKPKQDGKEMRTFVMGDVHGGHLAMLQCFERSGFNRETDQLIQLGDVVDGYPDVADCVEELRRLPNLIQIIGNHDKWFLDWALQDREVAWASQGGQATFNSYIPKEHIEFFRHARLFYVDEKNRLFVHGGVDVNQPNIEKQNPDVLMWDRRLVELAKKRATRGGGDVYGYKEIFVWHTSTTYSVGSTEPKNLCNLWMMDTGGGWEGKLTIMNVDTKEFWQSDLVSSLYPGHQPR